MANKNFIDIKNMEVVWRNIDDKFLRKQQYPGYSEEEVAIIYKVVDDFNNLTPSNPNDMVIYVGPCGYGLYVWNKDKWEIYGPLGLYKLYVILNDSIAGGVQYTKYSLWFWDNNSYKLVELTGASCVYNSDQPAGTLTKFDVGGLKSGTNVDLLNGKSYSYIIDWMLFGEPSSTSPTHTDPLLTLTFADGTTNKEINVGQTGLPQSVADFKYNFNQGDIYLNGQITGKFYGPYDEMKPLEFSINGGEFSASPSWISNMPDEEVTYQLKLYYKEGDAMLNSDGSVFKEPEPAGSIISNKITIKPISNNDVTFIVGNEPNQDSQDLNSLKNKISITTSKVNEYTSEFTLKNEIVYGWHCICVPSEISSKIEIECYDTFIQNWDKCRIEGIDNDPTWKKSASNINVDGVLYDKFIKFNAQGDALNYRIKINK